MTSTTAVRPSRMGLFQIHALRSRVLSESRYSPFLQEAQTSRAHDLELVIELALRLFCFERVEEIRQLHSVAHDGICFAVSEMFLNVQAISAW